MIGPEMLNAILREFFAHGLERQMSGALCERFPACPNSTNDATVPKCEKADCPGRASWASFFHHVSPSPDACKHDFQGWQEHHDDDGRVMGGEQVCTKCGIGAMAYSLRVGL